MEKRLSYPDSVKMLNEALKKERAIRDLTFEMFDGCEKLAIQAVNDCLIETAKKSNCSIYDLCFHTIPVIHNEEFDFYKFAKTGEVKVTRCVELAPVVFDLTHDGGYWKNKYFALKKAMRELIDKKEED